MTVTRSPAPALDEDLIGQYAGHLRDEGRAASTIDTYTEILRRMDRELPYGIYRAHTDELKAWINADSRQAAATRALARAAVVGLFGWLCGPDPDEAVLDFNPAVLLPTVPVRTGKPQPIPDDELFDILRRAKRPYRDWFIASVCLGARCMEVAALNRRDITERRTLLRGKGGKQRFVPTHPLVWALAGQLPDGPVAVDRDGTTRLTREQISHRGNYYLQRALGYLDVHMHRLRHTFGTQAFEACRDIRAVQELLGHGSVATTMIYVDASSAAMRTAVDGLRVTG